MTENHRDVHIIDCFISSKEYAPTSLPLKVTDQLRNDPCMLAAAVIVPLQTTHFPGSALPVFGDKLCVFTMAKKRDFYSRLHQLPPLPPSQFYCLRSTTTAILLFFLHHYHHRHNHPVSIMLLPPPQPSPHCFPSSMLTYCTTTYFTAKKGVTDLYTILLALLWS